MCQLLSRPIRRRIYTENIVWYGLKDILTMSIRKLLMILILQGILFENSCNGFSFVWPRRQHKLENNGMDTDQIREHLRELLPYLESFPNLSKFIRNDQVLISKSCFNERQFLWINVLWNLVIFRPYHFRWTRHLRQVEMRHLKSLLLLLLTASNTTLVFGKLNENLLQEKDREF